MNIDQELERAFSHLIDRPWGRTPSADWHPAIDLYETEDAYHLVADLPGVEPETIDLRVTAHSITLSGSRAFIRQTKTPMRVFTERSQGQFKRRFEVSKVIDRSAVTYEIQNGIYEAYLPKREETEA